MSLNMRIHEPSSKNNSIMPIHSQTTVITIGLPLVNTINVSNSMPHYNKAINNSIFSTIHT